MGKGKKMITFTDSRQATARIAIKLQQEAERNYVRGLIFNNEGKIINTFPMGDYSSGRNFYYRIPADTFHTQLFKKDTFFHEVSEGPFNRDETIIASWAPDEKDIVKTKKYMSDIIKECLIY